MSEPACPACRSAHTQEPGVTPCSCCGFQVTLHSNQAAHRSAAFSVAAAALLVPAYALPVMALDRFGHAHADTIFSGVWKLWHSGLWALAAIVFIASMVFPVVKLSGLAVLLLALRLPSLAGAPSLKRLHHLLHRLGRWSMLDVFLVAFLSGIVRFDGLVTIQAQPGIFAFGASVVLTMLATSTFPAFRLWPTRPLSSQSSSS